MLYAQVFVEISIENNISHNPKQQNSFADAQIKSWFLAQAAIATAQASYQVSESSAFVWAVWRFIDV